MTNLVPLHIDKDTGNIVASKRPAAVPPGLSAGYIFETLVPITTWTVSHNKASNQLICQIFDSSGEMIFPDTMTIIDINTIQVTFGAPQAGKAHVMFFNI